MSAFREFWTRRHSTCSLWGTGWSNPLVGHLVGVMCRNAILRRVWNCILWFDQICHHWPDRNSFFHRVGCCSSLFAASACPISDSNILCDFYIHRYLCLG